MKKISVTVLAVLLLLSTGCTQAPDNPAKTQADELNELRNLNGFRCLEDFETYLNTGSKDPDDYKREMPGPGSIAKYPDIEELKSAYTPLYDIFDITKEELFKREDMLIRPFAHMRSGDDISYELGIAYTFYDIDFHIQIVKHAPEYDLQQDYSYKHHYGLNEYDDESFHSLGREKTRGISRKVEKRIEFVRFILNRHLVYMSQYLKNTKFRSDPENAAFSVFFSEDSDVLGLAVQNLKEKAAALNNS